MRMIWVALLAFACSKKSSEPAPGSQAPPAAKSPSKSSIVPGAVTGEEARKRCEALVPAEVRTGLHVEGEQLPGLMACNLYADDAKKQLRAGVKIECDVGMTVDDYKNKKSAGATEIANVGRVAWMSKSMVSANAYVFDGQVDCSIEVMAFDGFDPQPVAVAVEPKLDATTMPKPKAGAPGDPKPACDAVVPEPVRQAANAKKRTEQSVSGSVLRCRYDSGLYVELSCRRTGKEALEKRKKLEGDRVKGDAAVGGGGFHEIGNSITFLDNDTGCLATLSYLAKEDPELLELAKQLEVAITKSAIEGG